MADPIVPAGKKEESKNVRRIRTQQDTDPPAVFPETALPRRAVQGVGPCTRPPPPRARRGDLCVKRLCFPQRGKLPSSAHTGGVMREKTALKRPRIRRALPGEYGTIPQNEGPPSKQSLERRTLPARRDARSG